MKYEVHSNFGSALFESENDAISALWLLGSYHDIEINRDNIKRALEKEGYFEAFPLAITKGY